MKLMWYLEVLLFAFLWNGMEITALWVDKKLRNQGWGKEIDNGC